jgi:hypothetical protein
MWKLAALSFASTALAAVKVEEEEQAEVDFEELFEGRFLSGNGTSNSTTTTTTTTTGQVVPNAITMPGLVEKGSPSAFTTYTGCKPKMVFTTYLENTCSMQTSPDATAPASATTEPATVHIVHDQCVTFFVNAVTPALDTLGGTFTATEIAGMAAANSLPHTNIWLANRLKMVWHCKLETPEMGRARLGCDATGTCTDANGYPLYLQAGSGACGRCTGADCTCADAAADLASDEVQRQAQMADPYCPTGNPPSSRALSAKAFSLGNSLSKSVRQLTTLPPAECPSATGDERCPACPVGGSAAGRSSTPTGIGAGNGVGYTPSSTGIPAGCNCLISEGAFNILKNIPQCTLIRPGLYGKVTFDLGGASGCTEPTVVMKKLAVAVSMSVSIDFTALGSTDTELAAALAGGDTSSMSTAAKAYVTALSTSLISAFASAMDISSADVAIKSIVFAAASSRRARSLANEAKTMTVEYEISNIDAAQSTALQTKVTSSAATLATTMGTTLSAAIAADTALSGMMSSTVTVDSTSFTATESAADGSDDVTTDTTTDSETTTAASGASMLSVSAFAAIAGFATLF